MAGSDIPETSTANIDANTFPGSTSDHLDATLLDLNEIHPYTDTYQIPNTCSAESSLYSPESSAFLRGPSERVRESIDLEDRIHLSPDNSDGYMSQPTPIMDPWDGFALTADLTQPWMQNTPQSHEQTGSVGSSQCIEALGSLRPSRHNEQSPHIDKIQNDAVCASDADSRNKPVAGPVHSVVLEGVQPETLNTIMETLLKSGTKFRINLNS